MSTDRQRCKSCPAPILIHRLHHSVRDVSIQARRTWYRIRRKSPRELIIACNNPARCLLPLAYALGDVRRACRCVVIHLAMCSHAGQVIARTGAFSAYLAVVAACSWILATCTKCVSSPTLAGVAERRHAWCAFAGWSSYRILGLSIPTHDGAVSCDSIRKSAQGIHPQGLVSGPRVRSWFRVEWCGQIHAAQVCAGCGGRSYGSSLEGSGRFAAAARLSVRSCSSLRISGTGAPLTVIQHSGDEHRTARPLRNIDPDVEYFLERILRHSWREDGSDPCDSTARTPCCSPRSVRA